VGTLITRRGLQETREKYSDMEEGIKLVSTNRYRNEHRLMRKFSRKYDAAESVHEALLIPAERLKQVHLF